MSPTYFPAAGFAIVLFVSLGLTRRYQQQFFTYWTAGYGCYFAFCLIDILTIKHRVQWATALAATSHITGSFFILVTAVRIRGKRSARIPLIVSCTMLAASLGIAAANLSFAAVLTPAALLMVCVFVWFGIVVRSRGGGIHGTAWLAIPLIAKGLFLLVAPVASGGPYEPLAYGVDGALVLLVGLGMMVFLLESNASETRRLASVIEQSNVAVIISDLSGGIVFANNTFRQRSPDPIPLDSSKKLSSVVNPAILPEIDLAASLGDVWEGKTTVIDASGKVNNESVTFAPLRSADGCVTNFAFTARDITREVELENQLRDARQIEAIGRLSAGVAHDFNNVLTGTLMSSDLLGAELPPDSPLQKHVEDIIASTRRAGELTRQLLAVGQKQIAVPKVLNLNEVVLGLQGMLRPLLGETVTLTLQLADDLGNANVDPVQMGQLITNLAMNARDAMDARGRLAIRTENDGESRIAITVEDTGFGMTDAIRARIFEPFFTTKPPGKGTGLGLTIVSGIVERAGGTIEVQSEVGRGSRFTVYLPRTNAAAEQWIRSAPVQAPTGAQARVLILEDDEQVRTRTRKVLERADYHVLEAGHPAEALKIMESADSRVDLLLTDVILPEMNGREVAHRAQARRPQMRVIFMSGYSDNEIANHGVVVRGVELLQKPVAPADLLVAISRAMRSPANVVE